MATMEHSLYIISDYPVKNLRPEDFRTLADRVGGLVDWGDNRITAQVGCRGLAKPGHDERSSDDHGLPAADHGTLPTCYSLRCRSSPHSGLDQAMLLASVRTRT